MKAIQITMDEKLLAALDADEEVRRHGRSALIRRIAAQYLEARRRSAISTQYRNAYAGRADEVALELEGWEDEGIWPKE